MKNNLAIYQGKRQVLAARITDTYPEGMHNTRIEIVDADGKLVFLDVGRNWFEFHRPEAGGYFVDFSDGHTTFIAKGDFERMFDLDPDFREVDQARSPQTQPGNITSLPLNCFAPTNDDIAKHLREQADAIDNGQFGDLRNVFIVYETVEGVLKRQTCGGPCDLACAVGTLFMAIAQGSV